MATSRMDAVRKMVWVGIRRVELPVSSPGLCPTSSYAPLELARNTFRLCMTAPFDVPSQVVIHQGGMLTLSATRNSTKNANMLISLVLASRGCGVTLT